MNHPGYIQRNDIQKASSSCYVWKLTVCEKKSESIASMEAERLKYKKIFQRKKNFVKESRKFFSQKKKECSFF